MMRSRRLAGVAVAALALVAGTGAAPPRWTLLAGVPVPAGATNSQLQGVTAVAADDVWTAGAWWDAGRVHPLLAHWDGAGWKVPGLPALPPDTYLSGVDAVGPADVWAVGSTEGGPAIPSILRYDGATWQTVPAPAFPAGSANDLEAIDMRTADDGWAVGESSTGTSAQPLILRRQGGRWIGSAAPKATRGGLAAVAAAGAGDVWAVGTSTDPTGVAHGLVLHFDGAAWSPAELSTPAGTTLNAVAVAGPGDVWAAGRTCTIACTAAVWHFSAGAWRPAPATGGAEVLALVAFAPGNVWTLGYDLLRNRQKADHVEHWDGKRFTAEDTGLPPLVSSDGSQGELGSATPIFAAAGDPVSGELWAVGWSDPPAIRPRVIHRG
jgi:hypothetical protein